MLVIWFQMDSQRELLNSILQNQLDRVNLFSNLRKFKVSFNEESSTAILKYKLKLKLLENIIQCGARDENEEVEYDRMKKETEEFLRFHNEKLSRVKFKCTLAGCLFECSRHRDYFRHLQRVHPQESNLGCQYGLTCKKSFSTLSFLKEHISQAHQTRSSEIGEPSPALLVDIPCKCSILRCGGAQFSNVKTLMLHLRNYHAKEGEMVSCIFEGCSCKYDKVGTLRKHFGSHTKLGNYNLKSGNKVLSVQASSSQESTSENYADVLDSAPLDDDDQEQESQEQESQEQEEVNDSFEDNDTLDEVFMRAYCDFLNRLTNFQFIPQSSVQIISEEYLKNYLKANEVKSTGHA